MCITVVFVLNFWLEVIKLIIALDCGIKAHNQVDYAKKNKIDFIICDHHNPDEKLPNALAILNPKRKDCAKWLSRIALDKVDVIASCPTTSVNVNGLYFLAETIKSLINFELKTDYKSNIIDEKKG